MKNPPNVKQGDQVRVVLEGKVTYSYSDTSAYFQVGGHGVNGEHWTVQSVEVLPQPVKVGDIINGRDTEEMPVGSLMRNVHGLWFKGDYGWFSQGGDAFNHQVMASLFTVEFLPGSVA